MSQDSRCKLNNSVPNDCAANLNVREVSNSMFGTGLSSTRPPVLLHSCCGPCSTSVIERLMPDYRLTVFYFNPCITDREEYERRKETQIKFINEFNQSSPVVDKVRFIEGEYNPETYFKLIKGYENEPEGGERCTVCFGQRLRATALKALEMEMEYFTTTLSVSPHKNYEIISRLGKSIGEEVGIEFLDMDFKKKAGFQRSVQLAKEHGLYRQDYCGCEFSKRSI